VPVVRPTDTGLAAEAEEILAAVVVVPVVPVAQLY